MEADGFSTLTIFILVLLSLIAVFAVLGNGFVLGIVARFKKLRTFPNILIANLALADLMNALVNIPIYVLWGILNVKWFSGKTSAIISLFLSHLFILVNVVCMLMLMVNVFLAIALDLRYFTWKTNKKALGIDLAVWLVCLTCTGLLSWSISDIDLQDASVFKYRRSFVTEAKFISSATGASFVVIAVVFGVLAFCSIKSKVRKRKQLNLPRLQEKARLQLDIQAAKTVAFTILAFFVCYIPPVCIAILVPPEPDATAASWPGHVAQLSLFFPSGTNPFIYCFRARRFRRALKQLFQDPCGKTAFRETDQEKRVQQKVPPQNARVAEKGIKIANELGEPLQDPSAGPSKRYTRQMGLGERGCKKVENSGEKRKERRARSCNQVTRFSPQDVEPQIIPRLAWVDNHPADSFGIRSDEENPTCREDYTQNKIIVEVHPEPKDRSAKQKNEENLTTPNENSSKGEEGFAMVQSDSRDGQSNHKMIKSLMVTVDYHGHAIVEMSVLSETDPMSHLSNTIIMESPTANEDNAREVVADVNLSSTDDPSQEKIAESPTASADYATRITSDTKGPKAQPINQENVEIQLEFLEEVFVEDNLLPKGVASNGNIVEHPPSEADCVIQAETFKP